LTPRRLSVTQIGKKGLNILARTISQTLSGQKIKKACAHILTLINIFLEGGGVYVLIDLYN